MHLYLRLMKTVLIRVYFFLLLFLPILALGHGSKVDSLLSILKKQKEDTGKVNTLNELSLLNIGIGNYPKVDSLAKCALKLSQTLNYSKGIGWAYKYIGDVFYFQGDYKTALKNDSISFETFKKITYTPGMARVCLTTGDIYTDMGNYPQALKSIMQALDSYKVMGNRKGMGGVYGDLGLVYFLQGNYPEALNNHLQALKIDEEFGNKQDIAGDHGNIGLIYYHQNNFEDALKNYREELSIFKELDFKQGIQSAYGNIGNVLSAQGKNTEALQNHQMGLAICKEMGYEPGMSSAYGNIASIYINLCNYPEALSNLTMALKINKTIGNKEGLGEVFLDMGTIFIKQKQFIKAKTFIDSALLTAKLLGIKELLEGSYKCKSQLDSASGNYKAAFEDYKISILYADSLKNEESTKKLVSEQMSYEFEKKEAIAKGEQDKKDAVTTADKKRQQIIMGSVSTGLLVVLIFSFLLFSRYRIAQKQKTIIEEQKLVVEEKNKEVLDSITYAKRLQDAILPPLSLIGQYFPDSLILYKPKDIVAGDFYWVQPLPDSILVAACDCTGHGVPGAMVSVVCSNALNRAVKEFKITEPGKILDKTRELVMETFEKSDGDIKDGMDISLASLTPSERGIKLQWAGAYNPLWYIQDGQMQEVKGDKQPIGKHVTQKPFSTHSLQLSKGDCLYLFTDGYADQFGGPKGKKFKYKQLQELITANVSKPLAAQKKLLDDTFENWRNDMEQTDDVCIIGIRI